MRNSKLRSVHTALISSFIISIVAVACAQTDSISKIQGSSSATTPAPIVPPALHLQLRDESSPHNSLRLDTSLAKSRKKDLNFEIETDKIENSSSVDFGKMTEALIQYHTFEEYPGSTLNLDLGHSTQFNSSGISRKHESLETKINELCSKIKTGSLEDIKIQFDMQFSKMGSKPHSEYLEDAIGLEQVFATTQRQCYSGTYLFNIVARKVLGQDEFRRRNMVTVFRKGHVLPGYMDLEKDGWHLTGIEMTMEGASFVDCGSTSNLPQPIRVIDAEHFAETEVLKDRIVNLTEVGNEAIEYAAHRYGIKNPMLLTDIKPYGKSQALNGSFFSIPDPDRVKDPHPKKMDYIDKSSPPVKLSPDQIRGASPSLGASGPDVMPRAMLNIMPETKTEGSQSKQFLEDGEYVFKEESANNRLEFRIHGNEVSISTKEGEDSYILRNKTPLDPPIFLLGFYFHDYASHEINDDGSNEMNDETTQMMIHSANLSSAQITLSWMTRKKNDWLLVYVPGSPSLYDLRSLSFDELSAFVSKIEKIEASPPMKTLQERIQHSQEQYLALQNLLAEFGYRHPNAVFNLSQPKTSILTNTSN